MSQLKEFKNDNLDPLHRPIQSIADMIDIFVQAEKLHAQFRVGIEHERFAFVKATRKPLPYVGDVGIEALFRAMAVHGWQPVIEDGHVIALTKQNAGISLEPGGQVELAGAPYRTMDEIHAELQSYFAQMDNVADQMGIGFLFVGYHPNARREEFPWVPKSRYQIMRRYMPKVGGRGIDMMLRTCTVQANLDYENEADMVSSVRVALALSPLITALFANSPFAEGKPSGMLSERTMVWHDTDAKRCGFPETVLASNFGYEAWVNFVLDVPMYFIRREGKYIDLAGRSFREFMRSGYDGHEATMRDFADHLTTVFTEVRVKPQIEVRSADCGGKPFLSALPALWKGILYDDLAKREALSLMEEPSVVELSDLQRACAEFGFRAKYRGRSVLELCEHTIRIAEQGLSRQAPGEEKYVRPLSELVARQSTQAEELLKQSDLNLLWGGE